MVDIHIARWGYTPFGTFGRLTMLGFACVTVEQIWLNNWPELSCIPAGTYYLERTFWNGEHTFEVANVPGRTDIIIHPANWAHELKGCIGLGERLGWLDEKLAVLNSAKTFESFSQHTIGHNNDYRLLIREDLGGPGR